MNKQNTIQHFRRTTKETEHLKQEMLAMLPNSPAWRQTIIEFYNTELSEFVDVARTPYKRTLLMNDFQYIRSDLREIQKKPIPSVDSV